MHRIAMRLKEVRNGRITEAFLDDRMSFRENFILLEEIAGINIHDAEVYDPYKKIFLDRNIRLSEFGFSGLVLLHLFHHREDFRV